MWASSCPVLCSGGLELPESQVNEREGLILESCKDSARDRLTGLMETLNENCKGEISSVKDLLFKLVPTEVPAVTEVPRLLCHGKRRQTP